MATHVKSIEDTIRKTQTVKAEKFSNIDYNYIVEKVHSLFRTRSIMCHGKKPKKNYSTKSSIESHGNPQETTALNSTTCQSSKQPY
jgi:hypothetical protein